MWKGSVESKKAKHKSREEIKKRLLDSMIIDENVEFDDLNLRKQRGKRSGKSNTNN